MIPKGLKEIMDSTAYSLPESNVKGFTEELSIIFETSETLEELEARVTQHCYQSRMDAGKEINGG